MIAELQINKQDWWCGIHPIGHAEDNQYIKQESRAEAHSAAKVWVLALIVTVLDAEAAHPQLIVAISEWLGGQRWTIGHRFHRLTFPSFAREWINSPSDQSIMHDFIFIIPRREELCSCLPRRTESGWQPTHVSSPQCLSRAKSPLFIQPNTAIEKKQYCCEDF